MNVPNLEASVSRVRPPCSRWMLPNSGGGGHAPIAPSAVAVVLAAFKLRDGGTTTTSATGRTAWAKSLQRLVGGGCLRCPPTDRPVLFVCPPELSCDLGKLRMVPGCGESRVLLLVACGERRQGRVPLMRQGDAVSLGYSWFRKRTSVMDLEVGGEYSGIKDAAQGGVANPVNLDRLPLV